MEESPLFAAAPAGPHGRACPGKQGVAPWEGSSLTFQNLVRLQKLMENFEL